MQPAREFVDALWRKFLAARRVSPEQRLRAGPALFDSACKITLAGIHGQNPGIGDAQALEFLRQRLALARRLEDAR